MPDSGPFELFKPFVWLAVGAFLLGFLGYVAVGGGDVARAAAATVLHTATPASTPVSSVRNFEKHI